MIFKRKHFYYALVGLIVSALLIFITIKVVLDGYEEIKLETVFRTKVEKIKRYKGYLYLDKSLKIPPRYRDDNNLMLYDFIQIGDSLTKMKGGNIITLIRNGRAFIFHPYNYIEE